MKGGGEGIKPFFQLVAFLNTVSFLLTLCVLFMCIYLLTVFTFQWCLSVVGTMYTFHQLLLMTVSLCTLCYVELALRIAL